MIETDLKSLCSGAFNGTLSSAPIDQTKISFGPPINASHDHGAHTDIRKDTFSLYYPCFSVPDEAHRGARLAAQL